jgi:hypothetical protein
MSKRTADQYRTRDPQPTTRDPRPEPAYEVLPVEPPKVDSINGVPIIRVDKPRCARCGELGIWRPGGTTIPNATTQEMLRWRSCVHCRGTNYLARPMTEAEKARHLAPVKV